MSTVLPKSRLITYIEENHTEYYGKICELREIVQAWLSYIPATFPHYTRHTIDHSDEIVLQISNLLFNDDDARPSVILSGVEAYILVAAAYLHDAGMVTPDKEKIEILDSAEWKDWTTGDSGGAKRWKEIQDFRTDIGDTTITKSVRTFLADVQVRFLIADFVRSRHHSRAGKLIEVHSDQLGRCDFGDPILRTAIASVCVGHGLRTHELDDKERYPETSDIRGEKVNLRFLATLLRLGDLLDMRFIRACPMLIGAASPLPIDSFDHWIQYSAISHRSTTPERIEITAKCPSQDVHMILQDWCGWICEEIQTARTVMANARRHKNWHVPTATISGSNPTIKILPREEATYIPSKWIMEFDQQAVVERLSQDLYSQPFAFIRELIQNSLDALRCRMYSDLTSGDQTPPLYPNLVDEEIRKNYFIKLSLEERTQTNPFSGEDELVQYFLLEDNGIGMDKAIVEKYFLQIGRSFYTSDEFKRHYSFFATSRFGIGFLSVFSVSDHIVVDTFKPTSTLLNNEPLKITLSGVKNYLLHERSDRNCSGTRIEIRLKEKMRPGRLSELVREWCKRVEFPIFLSDFSDQLTITAESAKDHTYATGIPSKESYRFVVNAFPVNDLGVFGEIYIFEVQDENSVRWDRGEWARNVFPKANVRHEVPRFPKGLMALHGISLSSGYEHPRFFTFSNTVAFRIDVRSSALAPSLDRSFGKTEERVETLLLEKLEEILLDHIRTNPLATGDDGWIYKQSLAGPYSPLPLWKQEGGMIPINFENKNYKISLNEFVKIPGLSIRRSDTDSFPTNNSLLLAKNLALMCRNHKVALFENYICERVYTKGAQIIGSDWILGAEEDKRILGGLSSSADFLLTQFDDPRYFVLGWKISGITYDVIFLNAEHEFTKWFIRFKTACQDSEFGFNKMHLDTVIKGLDFYAIYSKSEPAVDMLNLIDSIRDISSTLPVELIPPTIDR